MVAIMGDAGGVTLTVGVGDFSFDVTGTGLGRDEIFTADTAVRSAGTFFRAVPGPMVAAVMGRGGTGERRAAPVRYDLTGGFSPVCGQRRCGEKERSGKEERKRGEKKRGEERKGLK
jgi:hypothetical protein